MAAWLRIPYGIGARTAQAAATVAAILTPSSSQSKVLRALCARHGLIKRYEEWGAQYRDPERPLLWMHASSVGEGLMALPILQAIREQHPHIQIAYTYFSPSAERFAQTMPADFRAYLPFDTPRAATRALDALRPAALVFSKLDVWPILVETAHARGVSLGLVSAAMPASSSRRSGMGAALLKPAYAALNLVGTASEEDGRHLMEVGVEASHIVVTGDTRYDQAWERAHIQQRNAPLVDALSSDRLTLVAGSTWPADETHLLPAWLHVRAAHPSARLIIAPHELHANHLHAIAQWANEHRLRAEYLANAGDTMPAHITDADVIIVNRMGILADLYRTATIAYVGGGFHGAGLHSVVEPAVCGVPVIIGPQHSASRDAAMMIRTGGAIAVTDTDTLAGAMTGLFNDMNQREAMRTHLATVVSAERGATQRSVELIMELLQPVS